jgi:phospholipid/cholesterol/gamma-HCH transport system substrate-binding protein
MFGITMLMWASFTGGGTSIFETKRGFYCYFKNVNGLVKGSPIWMSGMEIGNVSSLGFDIQDSIHVVRVNCRIKSSIWPFMTSQARVQLGTIGFLGDKYVEIVPGTDGGEPIAEGSLVETLDVGDAPAVFKAAEEATRSAGAVIPGLDTLHERMNPGEGTLGRLATDEQLYTHLTKLLANLTKLTADLQANQHRLIGSIEHMSNSVGDLAQQVNENKGTLGRLVSDPQLYDNLTATSARLDSILTKIDMAEGNLGLMVNDTAMYVEMVSLMARANNLISEFQRTPEVLQSRCSSSRTAVRMVSRAARYARAQPKLAVRASASMGEGFRETRLHQAKR